MKKRNDMLADPHIGAYYLYAERGTGSRKNYDNPFAIVLGASLTEIRARCYMELRPDYGGNPPRRIFVEKAIDREKRRYKGKYDTTFQIVGSMEYNDWYDYILWTSYREVGESRYHPVYTVSPNGNIKKWNGKRRIDNRMWNNVR